MRRLILTLMLVSACSTQSREETTTVDFEVSEGTNLAFDISPDGETIVFDLLGQLWLLPIDGGEARPLSDAVRDTAEDRQPAFSPDGEWIAFRGDRPGGRGLWLMPSRGGEPRRITEGDDLWPAWSPDGRRIAFTRESRIYTFDLDAETDTLLPGEPISSPGAMQASWSPDGRRLAFLRVGPQAWLAMGGQLWEMELGSEEATLLTPRVPAPATPTSPTAWAPAYSPDGARIAYFMTEATPGRPIELRVLERESEVAYTAASHRAISQKRARWTPDGKRLYYVAEDALWTVDTESAAPPQRVPFRARLSFERRNTELRALRFPEPGSARAARGFTGLEISPSGEEVAILALGRLWLHEIGGDVRPVIDVPASAIGLSWSPVGSEVAWSAGARGEEDLFATDLATGVTKRLTDLPGHEVRPSHSPDGRLIAFVHQAPGWPPTGRERVRVIPARGRPVDRVEGTRDLGAVPSSFGSYDHSQVDTRSHWSMDSGELLLCGASGCTRYDLATGRTSEPVELRRAAFLRRQANDSFLLVREYALWETALNAEGTAFDEPRRLGTDAALYPSTARDGSLLYVSEDGLRVRRPDETTVVLGWPLEYEVAEAPEAVLLRNARIIDGTGSELSGPSDLLVAGGRISRIRPSGRIGEDAATRVVDLGGRVVMPGLIALHEHIWEPALLPGLLYHGITTIRDPGSPIAWTAGRGEMAEAGLRPAPRIVFSGLMLHAQPTEDGGFSSASGAGVARPAAADRAVALANAFGAGFVKLREVYNLQSALPIIDAAHRRGLPVSGHHVGLPPLVAAGIDGWEHAFGRGANDIIRMVAAADVWVGPHHAGWASLGRGLDSALIDGPETAPFLGPTARAQALARSRRGMARFYALVGRFRQPDQARRLREAAPRVGVGTDMGSMALAPWEPHSELEALVEFGYTPMEAIVAATRNGAEILGALDEIGTIQEGKLADLLILDADPLEDIRNTRRIWMVIQGGGIVDRESLLEWQSREIAALEAIR